MEIKITGNIFSRRTSYLFDNIEEYSDFLMKRKIKNLDYVLSHEQAHFEVSKSFGYDTRYCFEIKRSFFFRRTCYKTYFFGLTSSNKRSRIKRMNKNILKICLAPNQPSFKDLSLANLILEDSSKNYLSSMPAKK